MENKKEIIAVGAIASVVLLLFFGFLQEEGAKFLNLPVQWLFVSILPILIALFVGGYITEFEGFGVKLKSILKAPVTTSVELKAADALADIPYDEKRSMMYLENMSIEKALSIKWLIFEFGKRNYYSIDAIQRYLEKMPNIEFFEVRTGKGQFVCYIPIKYFRDGENIRTGFNGDKIYQFVAALEKGNVLERYSGIAITLVVKSDDSLVHVLKTLRSEQADMAAVVSNNGRYLGVLFSRDVEKRVVDAVLSSQSAQPPT
jgi:CBS domain-containing protein